MTRKSILLARVAAVALLGSMGSALAWACTAPFDEAEIVHGEVQSEDNTRHVASLEGGIVTDLRVRVGSVVEDGQVVATLSPVLAGASLGEQRSKVQALLAAQARLLAEGMGQADNIAFPTGTPEDVVRAERAIAEANRAVLEAQVADLRIEAKRQRGMAASAEAQMAEVREQVAGLEMTARANARVSQNEVASGTSKAQLAAARAQLAALPGMVENALALAEQAENRIRSLEARARAEALDRHAQQKAQADALLETIKAAEDRFARTTLRAPAGEVQKVRVAVGDTVQPGASLIDIVPRGGLIVEGRIPAHRIKSIRVGMPASVRLDDYDAAKTKALDGVVTAVSADTEKDPESGAAWYRAQVKATTDEIDGKRLRPGMPVTLALKSGRTRTVADYVLDGLTVRQETALREH